MPLPKSLDGKITFIKKPGEPDASGQPVIAETVRGILDDVKARGDAALRDYSKKFDNIDVQAIEVTKAEQQAAIGNLEKQQRADTEFAIAQVKAFATAQRATMLPLEIEPLPGVHLGHRIIPIERVGAYVPGGRYPLLSAPVMTLVPAKVAGCDEVIACLPPGAHPAMIAGCALSGADRIFRIGGAQAIAAMAFGTETIPAVDKIFGPGNAFVNEAKRQVFGPVGIDQLAGPSEIFTVADETGDPEMIAADLLAQAEHDVRTRVGLITTDKKLAEATLATITRFLTRLPTAQVAAPAWRDFGQIVLCADETAMIAYSDHIAAEHLQVHTRDPKATAKKLRNYGSLFIGTNASVVYSDKCSGTNHTLPTMAAGKYTGGLWVGSYVKVCTHQWIDDSGVAAIAWPAIRQSTNEGMHGHRRAAHFRLDRAAMLKEYTE
ncbi:histidinol dehydrogenase [Aestuariivirga sp.]|uniref:histidinol dehydrogenase n=1 Tax=Aestuariivirga sp. TaxID=2650926 RepID=UPI0039E66E4F